MPTPLIAYVAALLPMLTMDIAWLMAMGPSFYRPRLGHLMADGFVFVPAVAFYLLYAGGLTILVILPAFRGGWSLIHTAAMGATVGLISYGAYDLTNHATMRDWPLSVTLVDMAWGTAVTSLSCCAALLILRRITE